MMKPRYRILKAFDSETLEGYVHVALRSGWRPLGGISCAEIGGTVQLYQAVTKESDEGKMPLGSRRD